MSTKTRTFGSGNREGHNSSLFYSRRMYENYIPSKEKEPDNEPLIYNIVIHGDSRNMKEVPDRSVHLIVTSPPYNVGRDYDEDLTLQEYLDLLRDVFTECYRVLVSGGRMAVNIAGIGRRPYIPLQAYVAVMMAEIGFLQRGEIIWRKAASAGGSCAWGSYRSPNNPTIRDIHEYILVFSKERFDRGNPTKTMEKDDFLAYTTSIWEFPPERATKVGHPAPFPLELPARLIKFYTYENDVVLDPFVGAGTTCLAAKQLNRRYIGYDIVPEYVDLSLKRLKEEG